MAYEILPAANGITPRARRRPDTAQPDPTTTPHPSNDEMRNVLNDDPTAPDRLVAPPLALADDATRRNPAMESLFDGVVIKNGYEEPEPEPSARYFEPQTNHLEQDPTRPMAFVEGEFVAPPPQAKRQGAGDDDDAFQNFFDRALTATDDAPNFNRAGEENRSKIAPPRERTRLERLQDENAVLADDRDPKDKNGRFISMILNAVHNMGQNAQMATQGALQSGRGVTLESLMGVIGGGAGGLVAGAARPNLDENRKRLMRMDDNDKRIKAMREQEKFEAEIEARRAQTELTRKKPELERMKREGILIDKERARLLSMWGKLGEYNSDDPKFAEMEAEAKRLGMRLQNYKRGEKPPPRFTHLGQVLQVVRDEETGEYYGQPMKDEGGAPLPTDISKVPDAQGLMPAQAAANADRDAARAATQNRFEQTFGLNVEKFEEQKRRGMNADAARAFGVEVRGQFERVRAIDKEIRDIRRREKEQLIRSSQADELVSALQTEALELDAQIEGARSRALGGMTSSGIRPRASRAPAPSAGGAYSGQRFSRSKLEAMRPAFGGKSAQEIERIITSQGGVIY